MQYILSIGELHIELGNFSVPIQRLDRKGVANRKEVRGGVKVSRNLILAPYPRLPSQNKRIQIEGLMIIIHMFFPWCILQPS